MGKTINFGKKYKKGKLTEYLTELIREKVRQYSAKIEENKSKLKEDEANFMPPNVISEKDKHFLDRKTSENVDKEIKKKNK